MRPLHIATVLAVASTGLALVWEAAGLAGPPAAVPPVGFNPNTRQPSPASQQEVSPAGAPTLPGAAGGDWLARARRGLAEREYWASRNRRGLQAPNRAQNLRTYFGPSGIRVHDRTAAGSAELHAPAGDGSDCDVADIYALSRYIGGETVTLGNVCKPYFGGP